MRYASIAWRVDRKPEESKAPDWRVQAGAGPSFEQARNLARQRRIGAN